MVASAILHRSSLLHPTYPLFTDAKNTSPVSYGDAWIASRRHRRWIEREVERLTHDVFRRGLNASSSSIDSGATRGHHDDAQVDVIVAYLSSNNVEYLLSVLGCTDAHVEILNGGNMRASSSNGVRIRPALLNYRWTADEIAKALQVRHDNQAAERRGSVICNHLTIILHGPGFEDVGRDVVRIMERDLGQKRRGHSAVSIEMPSFVQFDVSNKTSTSQYEEDSRLSSPVGKCTDSSDQSDAIILFTSGTSSSSGAKGVRLSHRSLVVQAMAKLCPPCSYDKQTRMVATTVPFFHVGGLSSALAVIMAGGTLFFPSFTDTNCSFQQDLVLSAVESGANTLVVVPAMVHSLLLEADDENDGRQCTRLRLLLVGGQSLTANQLERTRGVFPRARVVQTYACTEAGSSITFAQLFPPIHTPDATSSNSTTEEHGDYVGHAPAHVEISIFQERQHKKTVSTMASCSPLEPGIIATRGPHVMNGYWDRGKETGTCDDKQHIGLTANGWLVTNDRGYCDSTGRLYFSGRASDAIRSGGETIQANEVERVIAQHPNVAACAVFGLPDEKYGEAVSVAIVVRSEGRSPASESDDDSAALLIDIKQHCSNHKLTPFKRPKRIFLLKELPTNSSGKVLKHKLKAMFRQRRSRL